MAESLTFFSCTLPLRADKSSGIFYNEIIGLHFPNT